MPFLIHYLKVSQVSKYEISITLLFLFNMSWGWLSKPKRKNSEKIRSDVYFAYIFFFMMMKIRWQKPKSGSAKLQGRPLMSVIPGPYLSTARRGNWVIIQRRDYRYEESRQTEADYTDRYR